MSGQMVLDFLDQASNCASKIALQEVLQRTMDKLGFSRWAYVCNNKIDHSYPPDWVEHYMDQNYAAVDPIITKGNKLAVPFQWSTLAPLDRLSPSERSYYGEAMAYGLVDGLGVPVISAAGRVMFSAASDLGRQELQHRLACEGTDLVALAYAFHALFHKVPAIDTPTDNPLSERERECLLWIHQGKTSWEIAAILNITERTVIFHVENSKRKLKVSKRAQAAIVALARGYISP